MQAIIPPPPLAKMPVPFQFPPEIFTLEFPPFVPSLPEFPPTISIELMIIGILPVPRFRIT